MDWDCGFSASSYQQFMMDEGEMEEFRSEKSVKAGKSPEEIERLSVDENLSEMERASLLISTGQDVQKVCVIEHLADLMRKHQMECLSKIIPKICEMLPSFSVEIHEAASKTFTELVQKDLIPIHIFTTNCMFAILAQLDNKEKCISNAWLSMVLSSIPYLPKDTVKRHILTTALAKGQLSQTVNSRQASCKIIGALTSKFEPYWLKNELLSLATTLCQDVDSGVREVMCQQLNELARGLGLEQAKASILPELIELMNDEECCVQCAALETLCDLISFLDEATLKTQIVPLVKKFCQRSFNSGDNSLTTMVRLLGRLCDLLKGALTTDQKIWFIQFYQKLSEYTRPVTTASPSPAHRPMSSAQRQLEAAEDKVQVECRRLCAYNFPAMLLFVGDEAFQTDLLPTLRKLSSDNSWMVKRTIACGFHEIVKFLKKNCLILCGIYQALLKDSSGEVLMGLVHHLPEVMECFAKAGGLPPDTRQPGLLDFIQPLLSCEQVASKFRQWRLHEQVIANFQCLVVCMTSDQLYTKFVPIMFKYITGSCVLPVKHAAIQTLCLFIRHIRRQEQRQELCTRIIEECGKSTNCRLRLLFIDICDVVLDTFSRSFFKENFFEAVLELAHDPVVNIRLRLCRILPSLKSTLKLPGDRVLLQQLEQTVRKLISQERDPDASQAIREAVMEMDRIEVAMETLTRRTFFEADLHDQKKEEEERALLQAEERERESRDKEKQPQNKKLTKPVSNLKPMPSPRMEHRKGGSQISLGPGGGGSNVGGVSPSLAHRSIGKQRGGLVMKSLSSPPTSDHSGLSINPSSTSTNSSSSSIGSHSAGSSPSPSHASRIRLKSADKSPLTGSPKTSPATSKANKVNSLTAAGLSSKQPASKSKDSVNAVSSSKVASTSRKKQYGLEYSNSSKSRKRT